MSIEHDSAWRAAQAFRFEGRIRSVQPLGAGLINQTYLVETDAPAQERAILQQINRNVFARPELIIANHCQLLAHVAQLPPSAPRERALIIPALYLSRDVRPYFVDADGNFWRAQTFVPDTHSLQALSDDRQAREVGIALGVFHRITAGLDPALLHDTLPGFHVTPRYLEQYDRTQSAYRGHWSADMQFCRSFIEARRDIVPALERGCESGALRRRTIHGDPKLNNFLFDSNNVAVSLIDLDTVKPGLIHYDLGDCLRSCCNRSGEQPGDPASVRFDLDVCRAILCGYRSTAADSLSRADFSYLYMAARLLPFELGLRFFTDYLRGNQYFKVAAPEQNLMRAVTQFHLVKSIERQEDAIGKLVAELTAQ